MDSWVGWRHVVHGPNRSWIRTNEGFTSRIQNSALITKLHHLLISDLKKHCYTAIMPTTRHLLSPAHTRSTSHGKSHPEWSTFPRKTSSTETWPRGIFWLVTRTYARYQTSVSRGKFTGIQRTRNLMAVNCLFDGWPLNRSSKESIPLVSFFYRDISYSMHQKNEHYSVYQSFLV